MHVMPERTPDQVPIPDAGYATIFPDSGVLKVKTSDGSVAVVGAGAPVEDGDGAGSDLAALSWCIINGTSGAMESVHGDKITETVLNSLGCYIVTLEQLSPGGDPTPNFGALITIQAADAAARVVVYNMNNLGSGHFNIVIFVYDMTGAPIACDHVMVALFGPVQ